MNSIRMRFWLNKTHFNSNENSRCNITTGYNSDKNTSVEAL